MKIGIIFPGQGSQFLGMGKEFYDQERIVQELFEEASNCLDQNFVRLCFASSDKELRETINAQAAIFLLSASIYTLLNKKYEITPDLVAGHSSGEYAAIYAAGGLNFPDSLYLLKKRATFMEEATKTQNGGMIAVMGLSKEMLQEICDRYDDKSGNQHVAEIVNFNTSQQLVVSGTLPELEQIILDVKAVKGKAVKLNVAGAFHSRLMKESEDAFALYLVKVDFKDLTVPLVNNTDAQQIIEHDQVKTSLIKQISSPVLWWQSMQQFKDLDIIIEIGPEDKLTRMLKKEWPDKKIISVNSYTSMAEFLALVGKTLEVKEEEKIEPATVVVEPAVVEEQVLESEEKQEEI